MVVQALGGAGAPSYRLLVFLWELTVLKTSLLRTIFFWVKGKKCGISSKWKARGQPALGTFPRSFLPLRGRGEKPGGGWWREEEEGRQKANTS